MCVVIALCYRIINESAHTNTCLITAGSLPLPHVPIVRGRIKYRVIGTATEVVPF